MNFIGKIFRKLKENEKEVFISQSGSIKGSKYEKIRSGQSYLYKKQGMESEVIEVRLNKNVWGGYLSSSVTETIKRYPYFNTKLIEKDGDFYIVQNNTAIVPHKTQKLVSLGGIECNYHLIDITYYKKSIFISFHHALCDGKGIKPFVESLIWYYCYFAYNQKNKIDGIRYSDEPLKENETIDPFLQKYEYDKNKNYPEFNYKALHLPEQHKNDFRYEIIIQKNEFMNLCKMYNATPAILTSILMSDAIYSMFENDDKDIVANIAIDMRKALGYENTFKNCVSTAILPYNKETKTLSKQEQGTKLRDILNIQREPDYCKRKMENMLKLFDKLDELKGYEEKQKIMGFFEGMETDTYVISYLGEFVLGGNAKYIDEIHLYNSGAHGLGINMLSCKDKFIFDIKQSFQNNDYVNAFCKILEKNGLKYKISNQIQFSTQTDKIIKRKCT